MEEYCMECLQVNNAITRLVDRFAKAYYGEDFQIVWIDWEESTLHYNLQINDEYRNIDDIFTCMWYNIPYDVFIQWYDEMLERGKKDINLKNWYKLYLDSNGIDE